MMLKNINVYIKFHLISESERLLWMFPFCTTYKEQRDFIVLDTKLTDVRHKKKMACVRQYGLHVEAIIFPGGLQEKKTGRSGWEGDRKTIDSLKKGVPAADVSACGKMQQLTINFPTQLASGTGSSSPLPKKSAVNWGKGRLAGHNCRSYKALPNAHTSLSTTHTFGQTWLVDNTAYAPKALARHR